MLNLLEITGDDIARLDDGELRALIGLLCEADYRSAGLPTKGITWGGDQDANDGGADVVVRDKVSPPDNSFVPRRYTVFQVKKSNMPKAKILKEMRPKGIVRETIQALIQEYGGYVIVSSNGSTTEAVLKNRIDAMKSAVAEQQNHQNLHLGFLDRGRVATWVRSHASLILWVRNKVGRSLQGWRPYENWANAAEGIDEEFLQDDGLRLHDRRESLGKGLSIEDGLLNLRSVLSVPRSSVRMTGLSGVGKTRLVQALFDEKVGEHALDASQAFYTDMSEMPIPDPCALANQIVSDKKTRAILIIDNCSPDLHHRLTQICSQAKSSASLLTVEYDVRDDLPEETSVFRLEPASEQVTEKLIRKRFRHISQVDAWTIASISGGNARVAIAVASTMQKGETLSGFCNENLFERIFWQRHAQDENLLESAQACSLVYSFDGKDCSKQSELHFLASLVNKSGDQLYRDVAKLKERNVIQSRGVWRALLPHAIANRLAKRALESIPKNTLVQKFLKNSSNRLVTSFTRRLSYLHDCATAVEIVTDWLAQDGWIGKNINNLNSLRIDVLNNIAPVSPEKTLDAIERAADGSNSHRFFNKENFHIDEFVRLLRHLAYDPVLFARSVKLLCRFALSEPANEEDGLARGVLKSLFYVQGSGTHASIEDRVTIINTLMASEVRNEQDLGLHLLGGALEVLPFNVQHDFDFGARPRDYGYHPQSQTEFNRWFDVFIRMCTNIALSNQPIAAQVRMLLANNLRLLWTNGALFDVLEKAAKTIHAQSPWNEGWVAIHGIIKHDCNNFKQNVCQRLHHLEQFLKPDNLIDKVRTFALSVRGQNFDLGDVFADEGVHSNRPAETARELGAQVAQDVQVLNSLLPEFVSTQSVRLFDLGKGLANGYRDKQGLLQLLRVALEQTTPENRQIIIVRGFLLSCAENEPSFYSSTLDDLVSDDVLGEWFPIFQSDSVSDERGLERLHGALNLENAPIDTFKHLAWGPWCKSLSDDALAGLLNKMLSRQSGPAVAIEILSAWLDTRNKTSPPEYSASLMAMMRDFLVQYDFTKKHKYLYIDNQLAVIAKIGLSGQDGVFTATQMGRRLASARAKHRIYPANWFTLLETFAQIQPKVFLDVFLTGIKRSHLFNNTIDRKNPLNWIADDALLLWCEIDAVVRYPLVSAVANLFKVSRETKTVTWKPIVYSVLKQAPDLGVVLKQLSAALMPMCWSSSDDWQYRLDLFKALYNHSNAEVRDWAKKEHSNFQQRIEGMRKEGMRFRCDSDEPFE